MDKCKTCKHKVKGGCALFNGKPAHYSQAAMYGKGACVKTREKPAAPLLKKLIGL